MTTIWVEDILKAQVCFWTSKKESHPKTKKFWLDVVNWTVFLNPEKILEQLNEAKKKIQAVKKDWKKILIICEKKMYSEELRKMSEEFWYNYLNYKVPGGFLTNFDTLKERIESMNTMSKFLESDDFSFLTKKEQLVYKRKLSKVKRVYEGVKDLKTRPDLVIVVDWYMMWSFLDELEKQKIDNIIITSSNFNRRWNEKNMIMSNVLSYKSLNFVMNYLLKD